MNLVPAMVERIMDVLSRNDSISASEVHRRVGCWARGTIHKALTELEQRGQVSSALVEHRKANTIRLFRVAERQVLIAAE